MQIPETNNDIGMLLLPRLSPDVITLYIEATSDETESRMLRGLRHRCPGLDSNLGLKQTMTALRRGKGYRLPSDAEWNHACRAGTNSMFSYGEPESLMGRYGNTVATSAGLSQDVATLLPNRLGLFDMHGGLWEWCLDSRKGPLSPVRSQVARVQRGGSYGVRPWNARSDRRGGNPATYKDNFVGFRVAIGANF